MQKRSLRFSVAFTVIIVVACVSIGINKNKIVKALTYTSHRTIYPEQKHIAPRGKGFASKIKGLKLTSAKLVRSARFQQKFDGLMSKALKRGTVPVIVSLQVDYKPSHKLSDDAERRVHNELISDIRKNLLHGVKHNLSTLKTYDGLPIVALSVDSEGLTQLQASPYALDITEDKPMRLTLNQSASLIGATKAWAGGYTGSGQTVVILDSGVDRTHTALSGKVAAGACFSTTRVTNPENNTGAQSLCPSGIDKSYDIDSGKNCNVLGGLEGCDHGTHVANAAAGKYGIAPKANIISIQVMSYNNNPEDCNGKASCLISYTSDIIKALNYVYTGLRNIYSIASVNISLAYDENADISGYQTPCDDQFTDLKTIIDNLRSVNIPTVIASGNEGFSDSLSYPACISSAISVGATESIPTSDSGIKYPIDTVPIYSNSASYLNLLAPGGHITSAVPGGGFALGDGTSLAAAHVSGAWALLKQKSFWVDDSLPQGASIAAEGGDSWNWISSGPNPKSGTLSHISNIASGQHQHFFYNATQTLNVIVGDKLFAWVYLDPSNIPSQVILQWNVDGSWDQRAYWGTDNWNAGESQGYHYMGALPQAGDWVKLEVPAFAVGLEGKRVNGMAFTLWGGRAAWDKAGSESSIQGELSNLQSTGVNVTYTRDNITRTKPRIKIDAALGVNIPDQNWVGEYYNSTDLSGTPIVVDDGNGHIDKFFNGASPVAGIGGENFSVRWTRSMAIAGKYRFTATGDDGIRLYIDGDLKIDQWHVQGATSYEAIVDLDPGLHVIRFEYYQGCCGAEARLDWGLYDPQGQCSKRVEDFPAGNWVGEYFNNMNLFGKSAMVVDDTPGSSVDNHYGSFSRDWGSGSPSTACNVFPDRFSVRWTRSVYFGAGTYLFKVTGIDDWITIYIDGNSTPIINGGGSGSALVTLTEGWHTIKQLYYENDGLARANISWVPLPATPINLTTTATSSSQITLNWTANTPFANGFKIERSTDGGANYSWSTTVGNVTSYTDSSLAQLTTYTYRISSFNNAGNSGYSNISSATTPAYCQFSIDSNSAQVARWGGWIDVRVNTNHSDCQWITNNNGYQWIFVDPGTGTGNGTVSINVYANDPAPAPGRSCSVTIAGKSFYIEQAGGMFDTERVKDTSNVFQNNKLDYKWMRK